MSTQDAYNAWAQSYDTDPNRTRDIDESVTRTLLHRFAGKSVVEFGCGTGKNTAWVSRVAQSVTALDLSPAMLDQARRRGLSGVRWERIDAGAPWPVLDGAADVVTANLVLEHLQDLSGFFAQADRVLGPDGHVLVSEIHPDRRPLRGSKARFETEGGTRSPDCFVHRLDDYLSAAQACGLVEAARWEPGDPDAPDDPPRLLVLWFRRAGAPLSMLPR